MMIPFYMTDCDMHERLWMRDFRIENAEVRKVWDVSSSLEDLEILYRKGDGPKMAKRQETLASAFPPPATADSGVQHNSPAYQDLLRQLDEMQQAKFIDERGEIHGKRVNAADKANLSIETRKVSSELC